MKLLKIFILYITFSTTFFAQNVIMAKAFYKKAQKEYENKNYKEAINLLEKTVENLAGETNPDIIYLEAKSRYRNDINITKTKNLLKQFIDSADMNDERIEEVSNLLVDIEVSKKLDEFGNFLDKKNRAGLFKTFFKSGSIKDSSYQNYQKGYDKKFSYRFFEKGDLEIAEPYDGKFKQFYESGNVQFYGEMKNGKRTGTFDFYEDGEYESGKKTEKDIKLFLSSRFFDANARDMKEWDFFLKKISSEGISITEGYSNYNLKDYDIIIWSACKRMKYNEPFFSKVEELLSLGKYIIITASNACVSDRIDGKLFYSTSAANLLLQNYGIKFDSKDDGFNKNIVSNGLFFDKDFSFLGWRYPDVYKSKDINKNAKYVKIILEDSKNGNGMMALYDNPKNDGKLFTYSSGDYTLGLGNLDKSTGTRNKAKTVLLLKQIIDNYRENR